MLDFDRIVDRRSTLSCKWAVGEDELPMWIADMDFECPEAMKRAVTSVAEHGVYGYTDLPDSFFRSIAGFYSRRHGVKINTSDMVYSNGAIAALSSMVRRLSSEGDNVVVQMPVYNIFFNSIVNNNRIILSSDLVCENGEYRIDFSDLEEKLSREKTSLMIVCNPHNPVGKIWSRDELARIAELCHKHGVTVISDEVHAEFVKPGCHYTPFFAVSELAADISATIVSGSKTFNIAGLQSACVVAKNERIRRIVHRGVNTDEVGEPNVFSVAANVVGFTECDEWIDALAEYVFENRRIAYEYINGKIKGIRAISAEATYLMWIDVSEVCSDSVEFCKRLRELTGLYLSAGASYGECGRGFVRMNLATQRERVLDGLCRLARGVELIGEEAADKHL